MEVFIKVVLESGAMQAMWLCNLNFSDHQLAYTNLILQYTTQVLSLSLSQVHLYSLFQIWVVLAQIWVQGPPPRWHALTGFDGAAACWSLWWCCCVRCSGLEFAVNFLG